MRVVNEADILLVEDNPVDVLMTKLALKQGGFLKTPTIVDDGIPAIDLLRRSSAGLGTTVPDLIILDLNLKLVDGPEVLNCIRHELDLSICVAILSSSPADVMISRASEANCYFSKPSDLNSFVGLGKEIMQCYISSIGCRPE